MRVELQLKDAAAAELRNELTNAQEALKTSEAERHKMQLEFNSLQHKRNMKEVELKAKAPEHDDESMLNPCITINNTLNQSREDLGIKDMSRLEQSPTNTYTSERRSRKSRISGSPHKFEKTVATSNNGKDEIQVSVKMTPSAKNEEV